MSKFPHMPLFTDAFIADTTHLTALETGAYLLLLMVAWRSPNCRLPDDDKKLARWARVDLRTWLKVKPTVMEFWTLDAGYWKQGRLSREHDVVSKRAEVARQNGAHGGRPKSLKSNDPPNPAGSTPVTQKKAPIPIPREDPPSPPPGEKPQAAPAGGNELPLPAGVPLAAPKAKKLTKGDQALAKHGLTEAWDRFRAAYPRRDGSLDIENGKPVFCTMIALGNTPEEITQGAIGYAAYARRHGKEGTVFVKSIPAWLRGLMWKEYQHLAKHQVAAIGRLGLDDDEWRKRLEIYRDTRYWGSRSPEPGQPGCEAPRHLLEEYGYLKPPPMAVAV